MATKGIPEKLVTVKLPAPARRLAKFNAAKRGISMASFIALAIEKASNSK